MPNPDSGPSDILSLEEADRMDAIMSEVSAETWSTPLIRSIENQGGLTNKNKALFFELRFAYALYQVGIRPNYEIPGENRSTIDFGFHSADQSWAVELMRLEETAAVRRATATNTDEDGVVWTRCVLETPTANDQDALRAQESTEGETLKAIQRICQKCEHNGHPHKFPLPDNRLHALLVDFRTFLHGGDIYDRIHVGLGGSYVCESYRLYWEGRVITGAFDPGTTMRGAAELRERLHFIGFVHERDYGNGEFGQVIQFIANPNIFSSKSAMQKAIATWPLQPVTVLNCR